MRKDQADEFERELMQPLAEALRTRLGDAGGVHVHNEPRLMTGERVEYAAWLEVVLNDARTEVIFRPLSREDFSAIWQWGKSGRFIFPISQGGGNAATAPEHPLTLSPNASAKPRVCGMRKRPSRLAGQSPEGNLPPPKVTRQPRRWCVPRPAEVKRLPGWRLQLNCLAFADQRSRGRIALVNRLWLSISINRASFSRNDPEASFGGIRVAVSNSVAASRSVSRNRRAPHVGRMPAGQQRFRGRRWRSGAVSALRSAPPEWIVMTRRVTRPSSLRAHDAHLDAAHHAAGALEAARLVVAVFAPAVSLPMGCLLRAGGWGDVGEPGGVGKLLLGALPRRPFPACSQFHRRRFSVPFRPVPVALTGAAFRIWVPTGAGRGCRGVMFDEFPRNKWACASFGLPR